MSKEINISVPSEQSSIPLSNYQKYVKLIQDNGEDMSDEFLSTKILEIFCGITLKEAYSVPVKELEFIVSHILELLNKEAKLQHRFTMTDPSGKTVEFGFMPNMDEMSLGEYIDLEKYVADWEDMHRALAVMYRPITKGNKDFYDIEPYEGSDKYSDVMKDAPVTVALGSMVFFYHLGRKLLKTTVDSLAQEAKHAVQQDRNNPLEKSGDGINQSILSLEEMSENLERLLNSTYTNV
jgi:hypothetical protein